MGQLFFDAESIYEISKPYLKFVTDERTDRQAQSNMPIQHFQIWGRKYHPATLKRKWTGPIDKSGKYHPALMGLE